MSGRILLSYISSALRSCYSYFTLYARLLSSLSPRPRSTAAGLRVPSAAMKSAVSFASHSAAPFFCGIPGGGLRHRVFRAAEIESAARRRGYVKALRISSSRSCIEVRKVNYRPPGTHHNLLTEVSFSLPEKSFGLIFGRSGSGKTTLLHLLAGLTKPTSGSIIIQKYGNDGNPCSPPEALAPERVGMVFQFPERYFLADTILEEVTFGWAKEKADFALREQLALNLQYAINSVGLNTISLDEDPHALSGGYKRRLALAIQLVQTPRLLLLDEPLAGLDWRARAEVVRLLKHLKKEVTILVVSHDLKELASLVDKSWRMQMGGVLKEEPLPR